MITINLLPEEIRENVEFSKKNRKTLGYVRTLVVICVFLILSFVIFFVFQTMSSNFYKQGIKETESIIAGYQQDLDNAKSLQNKMTTISKIKNNYQYWSKFNYALEKVTPEGIYLSEVTPEAISSATAQKDDKNKADAKTKIKIGGYAKTKNDIGIFRDSLERLDGFSAATIESIKEELDLNNVLKNSFVISVSLDKAATEKGAK